MKKSASKKSSKLKSYEANWIEKAIHSNVTIYLMIAGILIFPMFLIGNFIVEYWNGLLMIDERTSQREEVLSEFTETQRIISGESIVPDENQSEVSRQQDSPAQPPTTPITPDNLDILVDKDNLIPPTYEPSDLVFVRDYGVTSNSADVRLRSDATKNLSILLEQSKNATGQELSVLSGYRSYEEQAATYNKWVSELGYEEAQRTSAPPGASEHQLGTTVDLVFSDSSEISSIYTSEGPSKSWKWLDQNAHKYGFVMSYRANQEGITGYKFEPWHWRYVGIELATEIRMSTNPPQNKYKSPN